MRYLLDSDIIIDYLRDYRPTMIKLDKLIGRGDELFVSAITNLELHTGESITRPETLTKINDLFYHLSTVDINMEVAGFGGDFRRIYGASVPDALIAASAFSIQAAVITRNLKHFKPIKEIKTKRL